MTTISIRLDNDEKKDPFYSNANLKQLRKAEQQIRESRIVEKTIEELEAMELE